MTLAFQLMVLGSLLGGLTQLRAQEPTQASSTAAAPRILIAYFSWGGNTREITRQIHEQVGGDYFEIKTVKPYPSDYRETTELAKAEQDKKERPALTAKLDHPETYDIIILGYPNWWGTLPMPVFTFLEQTKLSGKRILPVCTHEGSALGSSLVDIRRLCPDAKIGEGLAIRGGRVRRAQDEVKAWLTKNGIPLKAK